MTTPHAARYQQRSSRKDAKYFQSPTPPKVVGHGRNIVVKKSKQDRTPGRKRKEDELQILEVKVRESQRHAFAAGTWVGYENNLTRYLHFCQYFSLKPFLLSRRVSTLFSQFMANNRVQSKTIRGKLSSLKFLGRVYGYPLLEKQFFGVNLLLRGIEKVNGKIKKQVPQITPDLLILIHSVLEFRKPFEVTMWVLFLTCFFLMLKSLMLLQHHKFWIKKFSEGEILKGK